MVKSINNSNKVNHKKLLVILLTLPGMLFFYVVGAYATAPLRDSLDHERFTKLDSQMQELYKKVKGSSSESDLWRYAAACSAERTGWQPTGRYNCLTSISLEKTVASLEEFNNLQEKYYPLIDDDPSLKAKTDLDREYPNDFGKKFVVSSAEKTYTENKSVIKCSYLIDLNQNRKITTESENNYSYGIPIENKSGRVIISFRCSEIARKPWFTLLNSTSDLIPDMSDQQTYDPNYDAPNR